MLTGPGVTGPLRAALRVAEAAALARAGDLTAAVAVLAEASGHAELDLLARIHAQRGEFEQADLCWARIQATDPEHDGAAAGRATIAAIRSRRLRPRPVLRPLRAAVAGVLIVATVFLAVADESTDSGAPTPAADHTVTTRISAPPQR